MRQYPTILYTLSVLLLSILLWMPTADAQRVLRVGWYDYSPLSSYHPEMIPEGMDGQEDLPGVHSGYNYEYLRMISQIHDWQLKFIYGTIQESLDRLQSGEVDLVGGVGKIPSREELFAFPTNSVLRASVGLIARADDSRFSMNDFTSFHGIRVGAVPGTNPLFQVEQWSRQRNIPLDIVYFNSFQELYDALDVGSIDALADSLIAPMPNHKILASMASQDIYFMGNKHDPQLIQELDDAITQIQYLQPGYQEALSAKYLYTQTYSGFTLSKREQAYLDQLLADDQPLQVSFGTDCFPIEYFDPSGSTIHGIMADIFERISQLTGLKFQYVPKNDLNDPTAQADIVAAMNTDFSWGDRHNTYLTQSVFQVPIFMVSLPEQGKSAVVAVRQDTQLAEKVIQRLAQKDEPVRYLYLNTTEDCMNAVRDGRAGRTYINSYEHNYYMNQNKFSHLKTQPVPGFFESISIGIAKDSDPRLFAIICQALRSISPSEMNSIILKNTTFNTPVACSISSMRIPWAHWLRVPCFAYYWVESAFSITAIKRTAACAKNWSTL